MRPDTLSPLFAALASPERRRMLELARETPGLTVAALAAHFRMSSVGVLKHVKILEAVGLLIARKQGRERRLFFNLMPIQAVYDHWTDEYSRFWGGHLADLKTRLESPTQPAADVPPARKARRHA
jgi:DNA-binding transcriptional ArsR family regulator